MEHLNRGEIALDRPLRVILNDRPLRQTLTGVGHYIYQLMLQFDAHPDDVRVDPFFFKTLGRQDWRRRPHDENDAKVRNAKAQRDLGGSRKPWWLRRLMQQAYGLGFRWSAKKYDLYHEPNHIPMHADVPIVTTVHDLSVLAHPKWHPTDRVRWYEAEFEKGVARTTRFIAASEFTKQEMVRRLNVDPQRIDVTYQAPRAAFSVAGPERVRHVLEELRLPSRFFLYVGTLEPRKNIPCLLESYAALPGPLRERFPLVIVGAWGWNQDAVRDRVSHLIGKTVHMIGYQNDEQLAALYSACTALVWPTYYEGFGLPPLEAMACGAAVIVSQCTSLPEVVGDAGVQVQVDKVPAWTEALRRMAEDTDYRNDLRRRGLARAATFSWERCAAETIACYGKVVTGKSPENATKTRDSAKAAGKPASVTPKPAKPKIPQ